MHSPQQLQHLYQQNDQNIFYYPFLFLLLLRLKRQFLLSVTEGLVALGEVTIRIRRNNKIYSGHSADTDVVVAAANAYVNALNRLVFSEKKNSIHPQFDNLDNTETKFLSNHTN